MRGECGFIFSLTCALVLLLGLEMHGSLVADREMASLNRDVRADYENVLRRKLKIAIVRSPQMENGCQ